jgi:hypothetical protein
MSANRERTPGPRLQVTAAAARQGPKPNFTLVLKPHIAPRFWATRLKNDRADCVLD